MFIGVKGAHFIVIPATGFFVVVARRGAESFLQVRHPLCSNVNHTWTTIKRVVREEVREKVRMCPPTPRPLLTDSLRFIHFQNSHLPSPLSLHHSPASKPELTPTRKTMTHPDRASQNLLVHPFQLSCLSTTSILCRTRSLLRSLTQSIVTKSS